MSDRAGHEETCCHLPFLNPENDSAGVGHFAAGQQLLQASTCRPMTISLLMRS